MEACIFCKIIKGEVPCEKIYEDEHTLAFLDAAPVNKGHTLIISKKHFENIFDVDEETLCHMIRSVKKVAHALHTYAEGVNIGQNNNKAAGQLVDHIHFHVIPRFSNDGFKHWPQQSYTTGEAKKVAKEIKNLL